MTTKQKGGGADMGRKPRKRGNPAVIGEEPLRDRMKQPLKRKKANGKNFKLGKKI